MCGDRGKNKTWHSLIASWHFTDSDIALSRNFCGVWFKNICVSACVNSLPKTCA